MVHAPDTTPRSRGRPKGTGAQRVYDGLREDILHLRLAPGANIEEATLERRFNVSRTPVREALIRLAADGLITLLPNRGAQVAEIDFSEVPQFFEALDVCQRLVLRLVALRATPAQIEEMHAINTAFAEASAAHDVVAMSELNHELHAAMGRACGNRFVRDLYDELLSVGLRLARSAFGTALETSSVDEPYFDTVVEQHAAMIDAMAARNAEGADALGRQHTDLFRGRILRAIDSGLGRDMDLSEIDPERG